VARAEVPHTGTLTELLQEDWGNTDKALPVGLLLQLAEAAVVVEAVEQVQQEVLEVSRVAVLEVLEFHLPLREHLYITAAAVAAPDRTHPLQEELAVEARARQMEPLQVVLQSLVVVVAPLMETRRAQEALVSQLSQSQLQVTRPPTLDP